ncbi:hypothetical protein [Patiriisocius sp. Uisw_017]|uniref:hypothetical protein n=1 Tax=Patiriisocius sp. Uisw_017 TaxID=3230968 RepID=UPI0039EB263B
MEITLIKALLYSILPTLIGTLLTLFFTEKLKGKVKSGFDKKLEEVKNLHNLEISKFQAEINSLKSKENFKFTKLHEKRFDILEELYKLLNKSISELNYYISPVKSTPNGMTHDEHEDKLQEKFSNAHFEFANFYANNRIYLEQKITKLIDNYLNEIAEIYNDYNKHHFLKKFGDRPNPETHRIAYSAYKKIPSKITPIKKEIEESFRELLER